MIIRPAEKKDCQAVADIHLREINRGFLNTLGAKFLCLFYEAMVDSKNSFLIVAEDSGKVAGFISGCVNLKQFYKEFFKKYKIKSLIILFKKAFNFSIIKKIWETAKYSKKDEPDLPPAELLSIAVIENFRGQGVARGLLNSLIDEMSKRGVSHFKVVVGENLGPANRFYEKCGFKFHSKSFVHKGVPSNIYIYKIK